LAVVAGYAVFAGMGRRGKERVSSKKASGESAAGRPNWVDKAGVAIAAVGVLVAIVALTDDSGSHAGGPGKLTVVDKAVLDSTRNFHPHPRLELTVHNTGGKLIVVDRASFRIKRVYALPRCASQDDIPLSNTYGVGLPIDARPGERIEAPLHQQVGADEADRFAVGLSAKLPRDQPTSTVYLFALDVSLRTDGPEGELPLGAMLISLPVIPYPGEYYWAADTPEIIGNLLAASPDYARQLKQFSMPCWRRNTAILRRALDKPYLRSPHLNALSAELVTPTNAVFR
jgi:hypothetical protein